MRTRKETKQAEEFFDHRVWYERHQVLVHDVESGHKTCDPEIYKRAKKAAKKIEEKYGLDKLVLPAKDSNFEWGMINGKLSALRWMLGDEWDNLDT